MATLAALQWQDWLGFAGACLLLLSLFLQSFAPRLDGGRWRALLGLLGAAALLPSAWLAFRAPLFFLLVGWILVCAYRLVRVPDAGSGAGESLLQAKSRMTSHSAAGSIRVPPSRAQRGIRRERDRGPQQQIPRCARDDILLDAATVGPVGPGDARTVGHSNR